MVYLKILLTNDDGVLSPGLVAAARALSTRHTVYVVAPEAQLSGIGAARTYTRPIRLSRVWAAGLYNNVEAYAVDGTPADAVFMGVKLFKPDLVVSGVNVGENIGLESIYISGTLGAAIQAALMGVHALALSVEAPPSLKFTQPQLSLDYFQQAASIALSLIDAASERGWPRGVDVISVNMPRPDRWRGGFVVTVNLAERIYDEELIEGKDPRGGTIYWRWGGVLSSLSEDSDAYQLYYRSMLVVTPINVRLLEAIGDEAVREVEALVREALMRVTKP